MNCPVCKSVELQMTDRQGVEIDYCPQCRGIWLDRGELDKLIERSASPAPQVARPAESKRDHDRYEYETKKKKKPGSFLGELFDF